MGIKICPKCKSENVVIDGSLIESFPEAMLCKECGYKNINFPEKVKITKSKKSRN